MDQVDAIFSSTSKCKGTPTINKWNEIEPSLADAEIKLYGRNNQSGTYGFFKKKALCKGDYKASLTEFIHSEEIISKIAADKTAMGYSGIGYLTSGVRPVAISKKPGETFVEASPENASVGKYPLSRYLYIYVNVHPEKGLDPDVAEFLKFVLSDSGQSVVSNDGYIKLPSKIVEKELSSL